MKITVQNGWRGPIEGIAREAAVVPKDDRATIAIPRRALIAQPEIGLTIDHEVGKLTILTVEAGAENIILSCRRSANV